MGKGEEGKESEELETVTSRFATYVDIQNACCLHVEVKKSEFTLIPERRRVSARATRSVRCKHLDKETFIPLAVNMPVLHGMGNVTLQKKESEEKSLV